LSAPSGRARSSRAPTATWLLPAHHGDRPNWAAGAAEATNPGSLGGSGGGKGPEPKIPTSIIGAERGK
jgi:hypothetical protein